MKLSLQRKLRSLFVVTLSGFGAYSVISFYKNEEKFYKNVVMPLVHLLDAEQAHRLGVVVAKYRLIPRTRYVDPESLRVTVFGKQFTNPVGIAAGFDKHGEAVIGLKDMGFGFIEVGSVTPEPQFGNDKPRVFRLSEDRAIINRYGFNSQGHEQVLQRIKHLKTVNFDGIIGVNLGKNKTSNDPINDYVVGVNKFGPVADYLVVNISSPNTPGLRLLQGKNELATLLKAVIGARDALPANNRPPVLLKLAPDLNLQDRKDVASVVLQKQCRIDGLIISNTTVQRPEFLINRQRLETGGLSGKPLTDPANDMIADMYRLTKGTIPIIGVGGIFTGQDAYDKIKAGASMVQLYTSMVFDGPPVVTKIKRELSQLLASDGYTNIAQAVGTNKHV